jgi:hypothetical protein
MSSPHPRGDIGNCIVYKPLKIGDPIIFVYLGTFIELTASILNEKRFLQKSCSNSESIQGDRKKHHSSCTDQTLKPTQMLIKEQGNTFALLAYFDASSIQGNPQQVQLSISIPTQSTIAHFNTTVPVTAGKTVNLNQSVTSKGYTATIDRVVMTPSETRFYYSTTDKNLNQLYAKNLLIGGQAFIGTNSTGPAKIYTSTGPAKMLEIWMGVKPYVSIMTDLQNKTGTWVINVSATGQPDLNWQFTFNIQ